MIELHPKVDWQKFRHPVPNMDRVGDWYHSGYLSICVAKEDNLYHMSVAHPTRYPTWDEIFTAWYDLVPGAGKDFNGAIILPRKTEYINLHPNCFHVYQLKDSEAPEGIIL